MKKEEFEEINKIIGEIYRHARVAKGLKQRQVAEHVNLESKTISDIERGKSKGSIDTLISLCKLYNITANDVLGEFISSKTSKIDPNLFLFNELNEENKNFVITMIKQLYKQQTDKTK